MSHSDSCVGLCLCAKKTMSGCMFFLLKGTCWFLFLPILHCRVSSASCCFNRLQLRMQGQSNKATRRGPWALSSNEPQIYCTQSSDVHEPGPDSIHLWVTFSCSSSALYQCHFTTSHFDSITSVHVVSVALLHFEGLFIFQAEDRTHRKVALQSDPSYKSSSWRKMCLLEKCIQQFIENHKKKTVRNIFSKNKAIMYWFIASCPVWYNW